MATDQQQQAVQLALAHRAETKALENLQGIVQGVLADGALHDLEIKYLQEWLAVHADVAARWPASALAGAIRDALVDGVITAEERAHLIEVCQSLVGQSFGATGSAEPEVIQLPIEDAVTVRLLNSGVCLTGVFLYGTRAACERLTLKAGAMCVDNVSKSVEYLVVGTRVSPDWAHTSYGRKIQRAVELQEQGHEIEIISERRWLEALSQAGAH